MSRRRAIIGLAAALAFPCAAQLPEPPPGKHNGAASARRSVPFKQEDDSAALLARVAAGLVLALGVGGVALAGYKRLVAPQVAARRLRLLQTLRLGAKASLHLVELDGATLLIGQNGEALSLIVGQTGVAQAAAAGRSDESPGVPNARMGEPSAVIEPLPRPRKAG